MNTVYINIKGQGWLVPALTALLFVVLPHFPSCDGSPAGEHGSQVVVGKLPAGSGSASQEDTPVKPVATTAHVTRRLLSSEETALATGKGNGTFNGKASTGRKGVGPQSVRRQRILKQIALPFKTSYQFSASLRPGIKRVVQEGVTGLSCQTIDIGVRNGKVVERKVIQKRVLTKPVDRIVVMGERNLMPSRGRLPARKVLRMEATSYSPDPQSCGKYADGYTSIGLRAGYGVVAVDPRIIPLGSRLFVEGYGYAVAADVGGAIKGLRIDLGYDTHRRAIQFGRRTVRVHVLD